MSFRLYCVSCDILLLLPPTIPEALKHKNHSPYHYFIVLPASLFIKFIWINDADKTALNQSISQFILCCPLHARLEALRSLHLSSKKTFCCLEICTLFYKPSTHPFCGLQSLPLCSPKAHLELRLVSQTHNSSSGEKQMWNKCEWGHKKTVLSYLSVCELHVWPNRSGQSQAWHSENNQWKRWVVRTKYDVCCVWLWRL